MYSGRLGSNPFFQNAAQIHFKRVGVRRQTKVKVEKTVVHRLDGDIERRPAAHLSLGLRETGHGAYGHQKFLIVIA